MHLSARNTTFVAAKSEQIVAIADREVWRYELLPVLAAIAKLFYKC